KKDADGNWEDPRNWNCIDPRTGQCSTNPAENKGYPNIAGDEAFFDGVTITGPRVIHVSRSDIRVAKIVVGGWSDMRDSSAAFTFEATNSNAQIILNSGVPLVAAEIATDPNPRLFQRY